MEENMESRTAPRDERFDLSNLLRIFLRRSRLIMGITAASAVVAVVVSLLLPNYFKAETRILPPQEKGGGLAGQLMGQAGGLIALAGGAAGVKSQGDLLVEISVWIPRNLSREESALLEKLKISPNFIPDPSKKDKGIFERMKDMFNG